LLPFSRLIARVNASQAQADAEFPLVERLDPSVDPVRAHAALSTLPKAIFFDSARREGPRGRYSYVAADPFAWLERSADDADALAGAEQSWRRFPALARPELPPFQGGLAGLLSYDLGRTIERLPPPRLDDLPVPALALGAYDVVLAFDHQLGESWIVSQGFPETDDAPRHERAAVRLAFFKERLARAQEDSRREQPSSSETQALAPSFDVGRGGVRSNMSADDYRRMIRRAVEYIRAGDVFQVNLAQRLTARFAGSHLELYRRLRDVNPAPFAASFDLGAVQLASASPECFLSLRGRQVETRPIKGTRGRLTHAAADLFLGDELSGSEKDRAENVMIVDLLRNDLSRACTDESVHVSQLFARETFEFVQHLVSVVRGELRPEATPFDLLRATFPGGSITGAPKIRAMEIIAELEPTARGAYCGSLAWIGFSGDMDASILIRTITRHGEVLTFPVGGGIVAQSDPDDEYRETWHKARGLLAAATPV
jgi:para-aminobenzoate synthetase component 1